MQKQKWLSGLAAAACVSAGALAMAEDLAYEGAWVYTPPPPWIHEAGGLWDPNIARGGGIIIPGTDTILSIHPSIGVQGRGFWNHKSDDGGRSTGGIELSRAMVYFDGQVLDPNLTYLASLGYVTDGGQFTLQDAFVQYRLKERDDWSLKAGQYKIPVYLEEQTSPFRVMGIERSMTNDLIGGGMTGRSLGAGVVYGPPEGNLILEAMLHQGAGEANTTWFQRDSTSPGLGARAAYRVFGDWANYTDHSARMTNEDTLVVGGGFDWTKRGGDNDYRYTADAHYNRTDGLGVVGGVLGETLDRNNNLNSYGAFAKVSYAIDRKIEPYLAASITRLDSDHVLAQNRREYSELSVGANYYVGIRGTRGHQTKVTAEASWLPHGSPTTLQRQGALAGDKDQYVLKAQIQIVR